MKAVFIILLMAMPIMAQDYLVADTSDWNMANLTDAIGYVDCLDSVWIGSWNDTSLKSAGHDTTKEYIDDIIKDGHCDTTWAKKWTFETKIDGVEYFKRRNFIKAIECKDDTIWVDKRAVWLTPEQYDNLMGMLKFPKLRGGL